MCTSFGRACPVESKAGEGSREGRVLSVVIIHREDDVTSPGGASTADAPTPFSSSLECVEVGRGGRDGYRNTPRWLAPRTRVRCVTTDEWEQSRLCLSGHTAVARIEARPTHTVHQMNRNLSDQSPASRPWTPAPTSRARPGPSHLRELLEQGLLHRGVLGLQLPPHRHGRGHDGGSFEQLQVPVIPQVRRVHLWRRRRAGRVDPGVSETRRGGLCRGRFWLC